MSSRRPNSWTRRWRWRAIFAPPRAQRRRDQGDDLRDCRPQTEAALAAALARFKLVFESEDAVRHARFREKRPPDGRADRRTIMPLLSEIRGMWLS